jgi:Spy/CpxP family protein refolding chaperone
MMGGPMMQGHGMMGGVSPYAAGVLGLSDEQQQRIDGMQRERAREHWQLMQQMRQEGRELMQLQRSPDADPDAIAEAHERFSTTQREMLRMQAETRRAMRGILTEEQRQRLDEMQESGGAQ